MKPLQTFVMALGMCAIISAMVWLHAPRAQVSDTAPPLASEVTAARVVKEFPSYQHPIGHTVRNIVIAPDPSLEALIALAKQLHRDDPKSVFLIFTDGNAQQFRRYMLWDTHFSKPDFARYPYPEAWANRHNIAIINRFWIGGSGRWKLQLNRGTGVKPSVEYGHLVDLE